MKKAILLLAFLLVPQPSFAQDEEAAPAEVTTEATTEEAEATDADEATETPEAPAEEGEESAEDDAVPETVEEAVETGHALYDAIHAKNWTLVFAFSVMIVVFIVRKLGLLAKLPGHAVVWVSVGIGVLVSVASGLLSGLGVIDAVLTRQKASCRCVPGYKR